MVAMVAASQRVWNDESSQCLRGRRERVSKLTWRESMLRAMLGSWRHSGEVGSKAIEEKGVFLYMCSSRLFVIY